MKYVMGVSPFGVLPVVFDQSLTHSFMAAALIAQDGYKVSVRSAGFVHLVCGEWCVGKDKSDSLGIGPHKNDQKILRYFLRDGLSGLSLSNQLVYDNLRQNLKTENPAG